MSVAYQRTIPELVALYQLEPGVRDVYVEGRKDRLLLEWFCRTQGLAEVAVYEIALVEVTPDDLARHTLTAGMRSSVIVLARELCAALTMPASQVTCVIDKDFGAVQEERLACEILLTTDFTSIELYTFDPRVIDKYFVLGLGGFPMTASEALDRIQEVLETLFATRFVNHQGHRVPLLSFERCCSLRSGYILFESEEYVKRLLLAGGQGGGREAFLARVAEVRGGFSGDRRNHIHGHDFVSVFCWYLRKTKSSLRDLTEELLRGGLFTSLEPIWLLEYPFFQALLARLSAY